MNTELTDIRKVNGIAFATLCQKRSLLREDEVLNPTSVKQDVLPESGLTFFDVSVHVSDTHISTDQSSSSEIKDDEEEDHLRVCIKTDSEVPFLWENASKQMGTVGPSVLVQRMKPVDKDRFKRTIEYLRNGNIVAWIGHSGIGKSTESTFLLMEFLFHLGEVDWPSVVAYRIEDFLYEAMLVRRLTAQSVPVQH